LIVPEAVNFTFTTKLFQFNSQALHTHPYQERRGMHQMPERLDAHEKPPTVLQDVYKLYQKLDSRKLAEATGLSAHLDEASQHEAVLAPSSKKLPVNLQKLLEDFVETPVQARDAPSAEEGRSEPKVFEVHGLPGE
jgi:hypothetical protein